MRLKSTEKVPVKTVIAIDVATTYGSVANVKQKRKDFMYG